MDNDETEKSIDAALDDLFASDEERAEAEKEHIESKEEEVAEEEIYVSDSSIDSPPSQPKHSEPKQEELYQDGAEDKMEMLFSEKGVDFYVKVDVKLRSSLSQNTYVLPLPINPKSKMPASRIAEMLHKAIDSKVFRGSLIGVAGLQQVDEDKQEVLPYLSDREILGSVGKAVEERRAANGGQ